MYRDRLRQWMARRLGGSGQAVERVVAPTAGSTCVFVFLGEFGYELLNWQGRLRAFKRLNPDVTVVSVSRGSSSMLYEDVGAHISAEDVEMFASSIGDAYFARVAGSRENSALDVRTSQRMRHLIMRHVAEQRHVAASQFIFSDELTSCGGILFGCSRWSSATQYPSTIYAGLDVSSNFITKLSVDDEERSIYDQHWPRARDRPRVLVMHSSRQRIVRFSEQVPFPKIVDRLMVDYDVRILEFVSDRKEDSVSSGHGPDGVPTIAVSSLKSEVAAISSADFCVFSSDGDFRSLHFVPPLCGRDVLSIVPKTGIERADLDYRNAHIFTHGGKIVPLPAESLNSLDAVGTDLLREATSGLASKVPAAPSPRST